MSNTRWAWVEVDLDAIRHNIAHIRSVVAPAAVWAVVKADGYGHGAVAVARAAMDAGAEGLCVALVREGLELRQAGIDAPILLLTEQPPETAGHIVQHRLTPTVYTRGFVDAIVAENATGLPVHLKIDTGMQRVGVHPHAAAAMAESIAERAPAVRLAGVYTHLAVADAPTDEFTAKQLKRFDDALSHIEESQGRVPLVHIANSAGALAHPDSRRSMVRIGIAMYGISPGHGVDDLCADLRPALELRARVSYVKMARAGSRISYGRIHRFERDTNVATIPIGYADGVVRRLSTTGGEVLIGGRRCPIVGRVTMDQLMVDCGDAEVSAGDDVVMIGAQDGPDGVQRIRAEDWADRLDTIGYEIVCGLSARLARVPRRSIDG
ncbi:MAG: alanine racemase [Ilumatobacter sp.]|nr:alanine racemase [Ilumatobacter sp.]